MPSLYETITPVGDVSSSNFTTLYNASGLAVPNAGAGSVTGNLNVGGNLTVQGNTLLIGDVTLQSTLTLPNYTMPLPDGTTDQVLVTDGNGNLYWTDVTAIPGAAYAIEANTATGGANLTLVDSAGGTDSVKLAAGTGMTITRTGPSTIVFDSIGQTYTIEADATVGGANLTLVSSGGATDSVKFASGTNISVVQTDANTVTVNGLVDPLPAGTKGDVLYYDGTGWTANNKVTADTSVQRFVTEYSTNVAGIQASIFSRKNTGATPYVAGDGPAVAFQVASDSQTTATFASMGAGYSATDPSYGLSISTDNYATKTFIGHWTESEARVSARDFGLNWNLTGAPTQNGYFRVNRGSSTDAVLTWNETSDWWNFNFPLTVTGTIVSTGTIATLAESISINSDSTAADSYLYLKGTSAYVKYDNTNGQIVLSDELYVETSAVPAATLVRDRLSTAYPFESSTALKIQSRVTNAASNATDDGGAGITFSRTFGASGGAEVLFGAIDMNYYGTTNTTEMQLNYSIDNFANPSPGVYPGTYSFLKANPDRAVFLNNSVYIDTVNNRLGVNTITPATTLDVNGDATISGNLDVGSITIDAISGFNTQVTTTTSVSAVNISGTTRRTQSVTIDIIDDVTGEVHVLEALAFQKGGTGYLTTYAEMYSGAALATFTATVVSGAIRILATPASTNSTTFTVVRLGIN